MLARNTEIEGKKILLIGLGDLGSVLLEFLAREPSFRQISVASLYSEPGYARCNLAKISAMAHGFTPQIEFHQLNLNDIERTAEFIADQNPDILISTATLQTWWLADLLPEPQATQIKKAGFGIWLPVNLTLTQKLMRALENCHYRGLSLTGRVQRGPGPKQAVCRVGGVPTLLRPPSW